MTTEHWGAELSSEEVEEEKKKGKSQPLSAENENAGRNGLRKEVKVNNARLDEPR
jgi:hypothetical protein